MTKWQATVLLGPNTLRRRVVVEYPILTREQSAAVRRLRGPVIVSAGPGCGGTEVVVRRFCRLVERRKARVDEVLLLTSSGSGVRELRERISRRLGSDASESAHIDTVQGFCRRVVREHAPAAGVDPWFTMLGRDEASALMAVVLRELIAAEEFDGSSLVAQLGAETLYDTALSAYTHLCGLSVNPVGDLAVRPNSPGPFLNAFRRCMNELQRADFPEGMEAAESGLSEALEAAERLADSSEFGWSDLRLLKRYRRAFKAQEQYPPDIAQQVEVARTALTDFMASCLDRQSFLNSTQLLGLLCEADARYTSRKHLLGAQGYDDLRERALRLLTREDGAPSEIARRYRKRYRFVLVDDPQSAEHLQWEIVRAVSERKRLFVVGDGRRSASDASDSLQETRALELTGNFRSRDGIVRFSNWLSHKVWGEDPDFRYVPLQPSGGHAPKEMPDVELILVPRSTPESPYGWNLESARKNEARAVAHRILEITGRTGTQPVLLTQGERSGQPVALRDIALLFRSVAGLHIYTSALREYRIPYSSSGGFCDEQEIEWVIRLLQLLDDPTDDAAMEAVLRSPFCGVSGETVASLPVPDGERGRLWEAIRATEENPDIPDPELWRLQDFREFLEEMVDAARRYGVSDTLRLAFERSRYLMKALAMPDGLHRLANVQTLCELAREFQGSGASDMAGFRARIRGFRPSGEPEDEDAARVMSIYSARDSSFPVVFVADMSSYLRPRAETAVLDPDLRLAMQVRNPTNSVLENPLCYRDTRERHIDRRMSEEKRLLFTTLTRAEEHLVLSGCSDLKGDYASTYRETYSWTGWLEKALDLKPMSGEGEVAMPDFRLALRRSIPIRPRTSRENTSPLSRFGEELREGRRIDLRHVRPETLETAGNMVDTCFTFKPPVTQSLRLSVSRVLDYLECPAGYRLVHMLGMPDLPQEPDDDEEPEERGMGAADFGHLVHLLLSEIDFSRDVGEQIPSLVSGIEDGQVEAALRVFVESHYCREMQSAEKVLLEVPFELMVGDAVLAGRIDALYRGPNGWVILDYKTGRAEDRERYELQVGVYAHAVHRLLGEMPSRVALLLLSIGDEWSLDTSDGVAAALGEKEVSRAAEEILSGRFRPARGKHCKWCARGDLCTTEQ